MTATTEPEQQPVDWIPDHLPDDVKAALLALTVESDGIPLVEPSESIIRHWLEATEDGHPLYHDEEFARSQGFRGIVAPPGMNMTLAIPYRWPRPEAGLGRNLHYLLKRIMKTPHGVVVEIDTEHVRMIQVGDRLFMSNRLGSLVGPKTTRMGDGYFWVMESIVRNQDGDVVVRGRTTMFATDPGRGDAEEDEGTTPDGLSRATEDALDPGGRTTHPAPDQRMYWDDVEEGDELPTLLMPITVTRCIYLASATRDFSPHHSNRDYAQQVIGARDMFANTPFNAGMLSRFVTDWGGPLSRVRRIKLRMRENVCAGDDMIIDGQVERKYAEGDEHFVDIEIQVSTQHGPAYGAAATLVLPRRASEG
jgi:acyl dehydratase